MDPSDQCRRGIWLTCGVTGCEYDLTLVKRLWPNTKENTWVPAAMNPLVVLGTDRYQSLCSRSGVDLGDTDEL